MLSQNMLLNKLLTTKNFSIITSNNLTADYFFNYKGEFKFIVDHFKKYGTVPDRITFINSFPNFELQDVTEPDSYLLEQLYTDYNTSYLATNFNAVKKLLENGDTDAAVKLYMDSVKNMHVGKPLAPIDIMSDTSRYDHYIEKTTDQSKYYVTTGFPEIDKLTGGIDRENEYMVISARSGIGKSWMLLKVAAEAAKTGLRVGIFSGEMGQDQVAYRLDTLLTHINNTAITRGDLFVQREYEEYFKSLALNEDQHIFVLTPDTIVGPSTVGMLASFVEEYKLDILIIDQLSLLDDQHKAHTFYEHAANISKDIKNLQVKYRIPVILAAQMNRTKNEDGSQDTSQIGLSDRIPQDATTLLMLDKKDDQLDINIVKARSGGDGKKLTYRIDLNRGKFDYIPSENDNISSKDDFDNIASSYEVNYPVDDGTPF